MARLQYYHYDELGSTRLLTDEDGDVTDTYFYDAYGSVIAHNGSTTDNPYQFVGALGYYTHYQTSEFKLLQLGFRFYDPETGRFTQLDPIGDGINWYAYTGNPVAAVDPWGLTPCPPGGTPPKGGGILDQIQGVLDVVGLVPGLGEIADASNAIISLGRGNYVAAALSAIAIVPVVGDAIGKGGKAAIMIGENMGRVKAAAKALDADYYRPWPFVSRELSLARNRTWIRNQIRKGREIIDIGFDDARAVEKRSEYYLTELEELADYPVRRIPWPASDGLTGYPWH